MEFWWIIIQNYIDIFKRDLITLRNEVSSFSDESELWSQLPGTTNSAGNLCLHLIGNLNHFIGSGLGKTGYERNRELEFIEGEASK